MAATTTLNKNNSAVKRIMQEARELANDPCTDYSAGPLEDDIFEWHCTLRGPAGTEFEGGLYHFRILLPAEYPFRPPSIMILTPNGRFELNTKICISFTNYHEELWQPAWGVRTAIIGLQGFFPLKGQAAVGVGSIEYPATERRRLAALSREWTCPHCNQTNLQLLPDPTPVTKNDSTAESLESEKIRSDVAVVEPVTVKNNEANVDHKGEDVKESSAPAPLTEAQEEAMRVMAKALHDRLDLLQNQEEKVVGVSQVQPTEELGRNPLVIVSSPSPATRPIESSASTSTTIPPEARVPLRRSQKPPMLLDGAICILLVLLFAIICRRMV